MFSYTYNVSENKKVTTVDNYYTIINPQPDLQANATDEETGIYSSLFQTGTIQDPGTARYHQPIFASSEVETLITDNILAAEKYPFDISANNIRNIDFKITDTMVILNDTSVTATKPILIECIGDTLRVWNATHNPNNAITTQGNMFVDGYKLLDYYNNDVKSKYIYEYKSWKVNTDKIQRLSVSGGNNNVQIYKSLCKDLVIKNSGKNALLFEKAQNDVENLNIINNNGEIIFDNIICDKLDLDNRGTGIVTNVTVKTSSRVKNVGPSVLVFNKIKDARCVDHMHGTGNVVWENISE